jgi:hypothetical protein
MEENPSFAAVQVGNQFLGALFVYIDALDGRGFGRVVPSIIKQFNDLVPVCVAIRHYLSVVDH